MGKTNKIKVDSRKVGNSVVFRNFIVKKETDNFFAVYQTYMTNDERACGEAITSGETLDKACKKAKLLQVGFDIARDSYRH